MMLKIEAIGDEGLALQPRMLATRFRRKMVERQRFIGEFLRSPATVGAIAPSSAGLAAAMLEPIDFNRARAIAEFGAGTGSLTKYILERRRDHTRFVAFETNPRFFECLTGRWEPSFFTHRGAEELRETLNDRRILDCDAVVSGLPWANLTRDLQTSILRQVFTCLAPDGVFVTFAYVQGLILPGGARFRSLLRQHFPSVECTKVVWTNVPPAFVYVCRKHGETSGRATFGDLGLR
jgi:phosphatidylethanolamine/phosphatidyl-N-methylethanolamine N-methyltransferase